VLSAVPANHIYGFLFAVLLPQKLDAPVIDIRTSSPASLGASLREGDLIIGHPAFWSAFARGMRDAPASVCGMTSTAPCPRETAQAVLACGLSRLVEIYGASETGGIGWRDVADRPFTLFAHWRRGSEPDTLIRILPGGAVETVPLPDRLGWIGERGFLVDGRRDGAVQVGGINVFPTVVREHLLRHPGVRDAAVRLMTRSEGTRMKAFIAPADPSFNPAALRRDLAAWCEAGLTVPERPKAFSFGSELPHDALAKLADWPILEPPA
jgi:4-coumarate--CoA ligase (photoactive yellow protein activation family)